MISSALFLELARCSPFDWGLQGCEAKPYVVRSDQSEIRLGERLPRRRLPVLDVFVPDPCTLLDALR